MMNDGERVFLLRVAREAIATAVGRPGPTAPLPAAVAARRAGVFVSLHTNGELRGCVGHIEPESLAAVVARCAVAASRWDPRFPSVRADELPGLRIELSVLEPPTPVRDIAEIEIGRHGLIVEMARSRGLLLPQVAVQWQWSREVFLAQTCRKAGLSDDAWLNGASIWKFEAEVFGETGAHVS
jgi:AmmeMemoRadiSam system protein A